MSILVDEVKQVQCSAPFVQFIYMFMYACFLYWLILIARWHRAPPSSFNRNLALRYSICWDIIIGNNCTSVLFILRHIIHVRPFVYSLCPSHLQSIITIWISLYIKIKDISRIKTCLTYIIQHDAAVKKQYILRLTF